MATREWISEFKWWDSQLPRSTPREESTSTNSETPARDVPVWVLTSTPLRPATVAGTATPCKYRCLRRYPNLNIEKHYSTPLYRLCLSTSLKRILKYHRKKSFGCHRYVLIIWMHHCYFFNRFSLRHVGDLGNMLQSAQGVASTQFRDEVISLQGQGSILGRSLVVRLYYTPTPTPSKKCRISSMAN